MKRLKLAAFGALLTALASSGFGCELIASIDRTKIDASGGGGAGGTPTTGGGGTGGMTTTTGGGGTGGTGGSGGSGGSGGGMPCMTPADCPDTGNECVLATCDGGVCGTELAPAGTQSATQVPADCQVVECNDAGTLETHPDDLDLPDDNNDCTDDACMNGAPVHTPVAADSPCGVGGMLLCDGTGQCVDCLDPSDCGADTECLTFTCELGVCGMQNTMQGTPISMQTDGDCQVAQCNGVGGVESAEDNADVPVDGTDCTDDVCTTGVPSNPPVSAMTACMEGTGVLCDGNGACVECIVAADCPGADDECQTRTCDMGVCGVSFTAQGTAIMAQTGGDCQVAQCDGMGGVESAADNSDLPNDNNDCTDDTCVAGTPTFTNKNAGDSCGATQVCDGNGQCVGCNVAADCPGTDDECKTRTCTANVCGFNFTASGTPVASQTSGDCQQNVCDGSGNIVSQNDNADLPADDGNECTDDVCTNGTPDHPDLPVDTACAQGGGSFCDGAGSCVECNSGAQCPAGNECEIPTCTSNTCGLGFQPSGFVTSTQTAGDCQVSQCDGAGNIVQAVSNGDVPVDNNDCTADVCTAGVPSNPPEALDTACTQGGGSFCDGAGSCVECNAATQCPGSDTDCQFRTCNSNACGTGFAPNGTPTSMQTSGDCQEVQCDGSGSTMTVANDSDLPVDTNQCTDDICTMGVPSNPNLPSGTMCTQNGGTTCDGNGSCISAGCSDGMLNGDETDVDCGGSCGPCALGKTCVMGGDCASTFCVGTVCVECVAATDCPGSDTDCQVRTCNSNTCGASNTAAGTPVSSQTTGDCQEVQCDGAGSTVSVANDADLPVDGMECTDDVCTAGVPSNPPLALDTACTQGGGSFCDGTGTCVECNSAAQCPPTGNECLLAACSSNTCGTTPVASGTPIASQTTGDCQAVECDGAGGTTSVADNSDLPVDAMECTDDVCTAGVPSNPNLPSGTACTQNGGTICDGAGSCISAPIVVDTDPTNSATGVLTLAPISVTFSTAMDPATLTAQTAFGPCSGTVQVSANNFEECIGFASAAPVMSALDTVATYAPALRLFAGTTYRIRVTTAAQSAGGVALASQFTQANGFTTVSGANACDGTVIISQVYGGGGNTGAPYTNDFVELHNTGTTTVDLAGLSLQYASAAGTTWNNTVALTGMVPAGGYFLVQLAGGANGSPLPTPDQVGGINMSGTSGKVALVRGTTPMGASPCPDLLRVLDFVGFGTAICYEGNGPTGALSNTTAALRGEAGCADTNANASNFTVAAPAPRNSATAASMCTCNSAINEADTAAEADFCNIQFPASFSVQTGTATDVVYGRIFELGTTEAAGGAFNVIGQWGYGAGGSDPRTATWSWYNASFNVQVGNDEEFQRTITAPAPGTYSYGYRFSFDGLQWTYCDLDGAGSNPSLDFSTAQLGTMTITP